MEDLASRLNHRIQLTTDGYRAYAEAVEGAFGADIDYAMLVKMYGNDSPSKDNPEKKYSPSKFMNARKQVITGMPNKEGNLYFDSRAQQPNHAYEHEEVYEADQWLFKEDRES